MGKVKFSEGVGSIQKISMEDETKDFRIKIDDANFAHSGDMNLWLNDTKVATILVHEAKLAVYQRAIAREKDSEGRHYITTLSVPRDQIEKMVNHLKEEYETEPDTPIDNTY